MLQPTNYLPPICCCNTLRAGFDILLVGDSLGMVVLGYDTTQPVTMEEMLHHCKAVRRGAPSRFVVG